MTVTKITYKNGPAEGWAIALGKMYQGTRDYLKLSEPQPASHQPKQKNPADTDDHTTQ